jgi:hypothetical protein
MSDPATTVREARRVFASVLGIEPRTVVRDAHEGKAPCRRSRGRGLTTPGTARTLRCSMAHSMTSFVPAGATVVAVSACATGIEPTGIELLLILPL